MYYLFDYGASWRFQIARHGKEKKSQAGMAYPRIVSETGVKPLQFGADEE